MAMKDALTRPSLQAQPRSASANRGQRQFRAFLIVLAGILAIGALVGGVTYYVTRPITLRIAVGPPNSDDTRIVQTLSQIFTQNRTHVRLRLVPTDGSAESAELFDKGGVDLAVIRGDLDLPKKAEAVAYLRKNFAVLWVPAGAGKKSKITSIKQLAGKRVAVIGRSRANVNLLGLILEQSGVPRDKVTVVQFPVSGVSDALRNQKFDAYLAVGPLNSRITAEALAATSHAGEPTFLSIDTSEAIAEKFPAYESAEIPAGTFSTSPARPDDTVTTINFGHHFIAQKSLSDATVAAFTRQLFNARQALLNDFPQSGKIETPDTDKDASMPVHPGAAAYIDGEEKTFLDKYSDYMWAGVMLLSVMGSVGAWFGGYLRRDERVTNSNLRERLLEMLSEARNSDSVERLDAMQAEADVIMRDTLHCFEDGAIEEGSLTAFSIALEQFHNAVADRKMFLISLPDQPRTPRPRLAKAD
ncbi:MAG: TAXI family TRAP transporter solute-binding subunit [Xanthobacteraceae bacterium]|nr:TAXI family TRAP transporter solute-binding subunit [Xanthobacteraceae bacterium]